jgi:hypothetical protein
MASFTLVAPVKWAQRADSVYLTISLSDVVDSKIELTDKKLTFSGKSENKEYSADLEFVSLIYSIFDSFLINFFLINIII